MTFTLRIVLYSRAGILDDLLDAGIDGVHVFLSNQSDTLLAAPCELGISKVVSSTLDVKSNFFFVNVLSSQSIAIFLGFPSYDID